VTWRNPPSISVTVICVVLLTTTLAVVTSSGTVEPEPCMSEVDRERTRAIIISGIDEGLKDHVKHMFEVWMKDDSEQPRRAVTGMHIARRAHRRATTQALEWNPPICEEKKP